MSLAIAPWNGPPAKGLLEVYLVLVLVLVLSLSLSLLNPPAKTSVFVDLLN